MSKGFGVSILKMERRRNLELEVDGWIEESIVDYATVLVLMLT